MRIHNLLIGGVVFWGTLAYGLAHVPNEGKVVESAQQPDDFVNRWNMINYDKCGFNHHSFACDFMPEPAPVQTTRVKRLYVSRNPSYFSQKALGLDR